jgi:hypothetical protein
MEDPSTQLHIMVYTIFINRYKFRPSRGSRGSRGYWYVRYCLLRTSIPFVIHVIQFKRSRFLIWRHDSVGFGVLAVTVMVFWDVMRCSLVKINRRFWWKFRLHLRGRRISQTRNQLDASSCRDFSIVKQMSLPVTRSYSYVFICSVFCRRWLKGSPCFLRDHPCGVVLITRWDLRLFPGKCFSFLLPC